MNLINILCYFFTILLYANAACVQSEYMGIATNVDASHFGGALVQKRTHSNFTFQSGLHFDSDNSRLIFVDRTSATMIIYYTPTGNIVTCYIKEFDNQEFAFVIPVYRKLNHYIVGANNTVYSLIYQPSSDYELKEIVKLPTKANEIISQATVDASRNLVIGTKPDDYHNTQLEAKVYRVDIESKKVKPLEDRFNFTAGIVFDQSNEYLYVADRVENVVYRLNYDAQTAQTTDKTTIFNITDYSGQYYGKVSGLAPDTSDNLWIAFTDARMLFYYNPDRQKIEQIVELPVTIVNSIAVDNFGIMYLGSGKQLDKLDKKQEPQAGALYGIFGLTTEGFQENRLSY